MKKKPRIVWPDYENCIANLPNSILKKWGIQTVGGSLPLADKYLEKDYKNVVILLLDGMGKFILEESLDEKGAFRSHLAGSYNSVFLSTTVAATTSVLTGQQPCEHSWLGWDCYYPQIDKNVTVFSNTVQGTEEPAADYHVARKYAPYVDIIEKINAVGGKAYYSIPFISPFPDSFEAVCDHVKELCKEPEKKFIYAYWGQPDNLLHRHGRKSPEVVAELKRMEAYVADMVKELDDTILFITADHGHISIESVAIQDYPVIMECLERLPTLEPRVLNLFVKEDKKDIFVREFQKKFGDRFLLLTMEEVIEKKLMGTGKEHDIFRSMLGNYLAIAIDDLSIDFTDEKWVSMHGSLTEDEMLIPLIVFD
ncbi:MAG: alkaline phosphatase family protein [Lachnospiraceae bacterium]|nr:alkaline phosphatase family protein [Lachnospiraceae bacterium]